MFSFLLGLVTTNGLMFFFFLVGIRVEDKSA